MPAPTGAVVWRDFVTDGVPSSGPNKMNKRDARQWSAWIESTITATFNGVGQIAYSQRSSLFANLDHPVNTTAIVYGDTTDPEYNGIYRKNGATGTGSWSKILPLPFKFVIGTDSGAGSANAIQVDTDVPVADDVLVAFALFEATTSSPVTVSFNGGSLLTIKTSTGGNASALAADQEVWGRIRTDDNTFRLISDQSSAALVAQAEAARDAAAASAALALAAVPSAFPTTVTALKALDTGDHQSAVLLEEDKAGIFVFKSGDYSAEVTADVQGGVYLKADDTATSSGAWVRQFDGPLRANWFGVVPSTSAAVVDVTDALEDLSAFAQVYFPHVTFRPGFYFAQSWLIRRGVKFEGLGTTPNTRNGATNSEFDELVLSQSGAVFIAMGDDPIIIQVDFVSNGETVGYTRDIDASDENPVAASPFTTFELFDGTNKDASGTTPATLRNLRFFARVEDGWQRWHLDNIKIINSCPGDGETYGLGGYVDYTTAREPADNDFGLYYTNGWEARANELRVVGYWRERGVFNFLPPADGFATATPTNEQGLWTNCDIQSGLLIRSGDCLPVVDKTSTQVYIRWFPSHRFDPAGGSIWLTETDTFTGPTEYTYTSTLYTESTTPNGRNGKFLRFNGLSSTTSIDIDKSKLVTIPNQGGSSHTRFQDCYIVDLAHHMGLQNDADELAGWQDSFKASVEISGTPMRAINLDRCVLSPVGPIALHVGAARDLVISGGTYAERRPFKYGASEDLETSRGAVAIAGPDLDGGTLAWDEGGLACSAQIYFDQAGGFNSNINTLPLGTNRSGVPFDGESWFNLRDGNMRAYWPANNLYGVGRTRSDITSAMLADASHPINLFGKMEGLEVWAEDLNKWFTATASTSTSIWLDQEGTSNITPS
ncbi:hypothetical protein [Ciceribacter sp. L1K22]|uniref:hypothetical protein n=1 Tax=Ciceribacter sp. L1K22 TaxID=2820275 RepID=UPI001ABE8B78|nr:hypothetical protein [Ciceribacter sp. L1K22]MBO3760026.1 hypothetical protein [Ciceribacter sp. L1K22]